MLDKLKSRINSNENFFIIILVLAMAVWGGSWTSAKIVADKINPVVLSFLRFFFTFLSFIPMIVILRKKLSLDKKSAVLTIISSILMVSYNLLFFLGLKHGLAGAGGVLVTSINPIFTFIMSLIIFKTKISSREITGLALGLVAGLILLELWNLKNLFLSGNLIFLMASFVWACLALSGGEVQKKTSIFVYSFYMYGLSSLILFFISIPYGLSGIFKMDYVFWINIFYLSVVSTVFATSVFFIGSKKLSANRTSSFILLVPVFAVVISFIVLGETPHASTIIGGALAICGIYLINKKNASSPWLKIKAKTYEAHMSDQDVFQSQTLNEIIKSQIFDYSPKRMAVFGVTTGNGLEHAKNVENVFAVDINEEYLNICKTRFINNDNINFIRLDIKRDDFNFDKIDLAICNLIFEYVDESNFVKKISGILADNGILSLVFQVNSGKTFVSKSGFSRYFSVLDKIHHEVKEDIISKIIEDNGLKKIIKKEYDLPNGKKFVRIDFQKSL